MRKVPLLGGICVAALLIAGCSSSNSSTSNTPSLQGSSGAATAGAGATAGSHIVIASVGAESGPYSAPSSTQQVGIDAWVRYTNAHGGLQGHSITLIKGDSKSDPTTEGSIFQQIVAENHPVAFVGYGAFNPSNPAAFIESQKIPVIGGQTSDDIWDKNPYYFAQGTSNVVVYYSLAKVAQEAGATKLGIIYCAESPSCQQSSDNFKADAKQIGSDVVFSQKLSVATPDFTATCLAAKSAGVQAMLPILDTTNNARFAAACAQQGFTPKYLWQPILPTDQTATLAGMDGALTTQTNWPWWNATGPGAAFHTAMATYFPGAQINPGTMQGWAAGALFQEAALKALASGGEITSASLLTALQSITNSTLGGLSGPISFSASSPRPLHFCWFTGVVKDKKWVQVGATYECAPASDQKALTTQFYS
jgi:branched-chain amino acid transport system substrate-binding protein